MSIQPFFRDEPLFQLHDEPPDTRKDVVTRRPDDDLYAVDTPPTYAMGLAERLAATHPEAHTSSVEIMLSPDGFDLTGITLDDLNLDGALEEFDIDEQLDRETLPSAPYPSAVVDDAAADLSWDVLPPPVPTFAESNDMLPDPSSDATPSEESRTHLSASLWGKLQKFVTGISKPRSQPPVSSTSSRRPSQRSMFELAWTLDNAALHALSCHIDQIIATRRLGPEAYAESRVVDLLDTMFVLERVGSDGVGISTLRLRIPEVTRAMLDHALLRLENRGVVVLVPDDLGQDGIMDPVRGHLTRCILLQTAS